MASASDAKRVVQCSNRKITSDKIEVSVHIVGIGGKTLVATIPPSIERDKEKELASAFPGSPSFSGIL